MQDAVGRWAWAAVGVALGSSLVRAVEPEAYGGLAGYQAAAPLLVPVAVAGLGVGLVSGRVGLAAAAAAAATATGHALASETRTGRLRVAAGTSRSIRVLSANLLYTNRSTGSAAHLLRQLDPDLVVLIELSSASLPGLQPELARYPHHWLDLRRRASGIGVWSRSPFEVVPVTDSGEDRDLCIRLGHGPEGVVVRGVHTEAPRGTASTRRWRRHLADLAAFAAAQDGHVLLVGDFNATVAHPSFRQFSGQGFTDAHAASAQRWAPTWPTHHRLLPALLRLDHVLVSPAVDVLACKRVEVAGSDHYGLVVDVTLPG